MNKKAAAKQILIILLILAVIPILAVIIYSQKNHDNRETGGIISNLENNNEESNEEETTNNQGQFNENQENTNPQTTESGEGGGSESSAGACLKKQISYSIQNPTEIVNCLEYSGIVCVKKEMNCSVGVHNLDNEVAGLFKIKIIFSQDSSGQGVYSELKELYLAPKESNIIWTYKIFESAEENGSANSEISCFYTKVQVPYKEIC